MLQVNKQYGIRIGPVAANRIGPIPFQEGT